MPPTFLYFVALSVWIPLACLVWVVAGAMALNRGTRRKALALALAMAATFPFVFLFQAAAVPLMVAMVVGAAWLSGILDPASTVTHITTNGLAIVLRGPLGFDQVILCFRVAGEVADRRVDLRQRDRSAFHEISPVPVFQYATALQVKRRP